MRRMSHPVGQLDHIRLDAEGQIDEDLPCVDCEYSLRTRRPEGTCPECGQAVAPALLPHRLYFADASWLLRLRRGAVWLVVGLAWLVLARYALFYALHQWLAPRVLSSRTPWVLLSSPLYLALLVMLVGWWYLTAPEPGCTKAVGKYDLRRVARLAITVGLLGQLPFWCASAVLFSFGVHYGLQLGRGLVGGIYALAVILAFHYVARLGERVPQRRLVWHARTVGWSLGATLVLSSVISVVHVFLIASGRSNPGSPPSAVQTGLAWGMSALQLALDAARIWALVLCILYARTFGRLARERG